MLFAAVAVAVVGVFLFFSDQLVKEQAVQERARMQTWADATRQIATLGLGGSESEGEYISFLLSIIEGNTNIPVMLTEPDGNIIGQRNFRLPEPQLPADAAANAEFLQRKLEKLRRSDNRINIEIAPGFTQHLYYEDSTLLRKLSVYPYVLLAVMLAFILIVYFAVTSSKKAEQNKVWVGLSKETAHQLGTPISSLMAWVELLRDMDVDPETVSEMDKDVKRLETIAARFSKIGSQPQMERGNLGAVVRSSADYMRSRISGRINIEYHAAPGEIEVEMSAPLIQWVMENLIKNAVDAMEGEGSITISTVTANNLAIISVKDTGKGMTRKMRKAVFRPGFTTKKRGWGLGLTLARRIVSEYHRGRIFVSDSEPGRGTTFEIHLPLA